MLYLLEVDGIVAAAAVGLVLGLSGLIFLMVLAWRGARIIAERAQGILLRLTSSS
jgi:hypothetical protein